MEFLKSILLSTIFIFLSGALPIEDLEPRNLNQTGFPVGFEFKPRAAGSYKSVAYFVNWVRTEPDCRNRRA